MSQAAYSPLKSAWHLERIAGMRAGEQVTPVGVQFIISDLCNHDCYFCAYRAKDGLSTEQFVVTDEDGTRNHNPVRMMSLDKAKEILKDLAAYDARSVTFTGGGEPTVHPNHLELFDYALSLGFDISLNTNGALLRDGWRDIFPRMAYIRVSIDAGSPEEYASVRGVKPSVYNKVLRNTAEIAREAKKQNSSCVVGAGYVVSPTSYHNLFAGIDNIKETGISYVRLAAMQSTKEYGPYRGILWDVRDRCKQAEGLSTNGFKVVNLFDGVVGEQPTEPFCGFQQIVTYIGANLKVYRCCYTAYTALGDIGDLTNMTYSEWFESAEKQKLIGEFDARSCATCPLKEKNETIAYMVNDKPMHINFP